MAEGTDAARAAVVAARARLEDELVRLEASARATADLRTQVRRHPARAVGLAAGAGFLALGGPRRLLRGLRHAVLGRPEPLPPSLLPEAVEQALRALGGDGARVRGALEREFARYLEERAPQRRDRDLRDVATALLAALALPAARRYGLRLAERLAEPDADAVGAVERAVRARRARGRGDATGSEGGDAAAR